jgi:hypothetical protein
METKICIYCGRTLDVNLLIDKAGKYRCKDENNCLDYQTKEDPANSIENADYISDVVKSSLAEAAQRIAAYKCAKDDQTKSVTEGHVESSEESTSEFTWMKTVLDALAAEYQKNQKFVFQCDETKNNQYKISFNDAENHVFIVVKIDHGIGSRYSLTVAKEDTVANTAPLYNEFIYRSYTSNQREEVLQDLSVILIALEGEKDRIPVLLNAFRTEIESRHHQ